MVPRHIEVGLLICDAQDSKLSRIESQAFSFMLTIFSERWTLHSHKWGFEWKGCVDVCYSCNWHKRVLQNFESRRSSGGIERKPQGRRSEGLSSASIQGLISQSMVLTKIAESLEWSMVPVGGLDTGRRGESAWNFVWVNVQRGACLY